jgi:NAD(P)-dependent dehydrogenase (short-subunit alcohol dehydrogenase family)
MAIRTMTPADGVAWVTGASSGIGKATVLELARRGWTVCATARRIEELEALAAEAYGLSGRVVAYVGDVTDEAGMAGLVDAIEQVHGPIALAFFNAGVAPYTRAGALDVEAFRTALNVNVLGAANGLAPVLTKMAERRKGQVAVNASVAGYRGLPKAAAYGASKAAAIHLCEALKFDCDNLGITMQVVNPGFIDTPLTRKNDFPRRGWVREGQVRGDLPPPPRLHPQADAASALWAVFPDGRAGDRVEEAGVSGWGALRPE